MNLNDLNESLTELTPVMESGGVLYKRDDMLNTDIGIQSGKYRQSVQLFHLAKEDIDKCDVIITPTSIKSPQGVIVSHLAKLIGKPCMLVVGSSNKDIDKMAREHKPIAQAIANGAEIRVVSGLGFNNVLHLRAKEIAKEENGFLVSFGINVDSYKKAILGATASQVANIPRDLDYLVIPVGSALSATGILQGLEKWPVKDRPKNIKLVQVSTYDRQDVIVPHLDFLDPIKYDFILDPTYSYGTLVHENSMGEDFELDARYEAKGHQYMRRKIESGEWSGKIMFWVIGNTSNYY